MEPRSPRIRFAPVQLKARHDGWTAARQVRFIDALAATGSITRACEAVGMSRESAYALRERAEAGQFRRAWKAALSPDFAQPRRTSARAAQRLLRLRQAPAKADSAKADSAKADEVNEMHAPPNSLGREPSPSPASPTLEALLRQLRGTAAAPSRTVAMPTNFADFAALHVPGDPVILYNIWDAGSALAVVAAGAKAVATGSHPVADANGWPDGQQVPIEFALANAKRIAGAVEVPLTVDFESAYSTDPELGAANVVRLAATGAVGCNFEDQVIGGANETNGGLHPLDLQVRRIAAIRNAVGDQFFINARTDLLLKTQQHDDALIDDVIERGKAFADAGASGFFVPRLADPRHIVRVVERVPLPLNVIAFPGAPAKSEWANAGVARISHGPFPHRALMAKLTEMAREAIA